MQIAKIKGISVSTEGILSTKNCESNAFRALGLIEKVSHSHNLSLLGKFRYFLK